MLQAEYNNEALSWNQTFEWWKCFENDRTSTDDDPRSGVDIQN